MSLSRMKGGTVDVELWAPISEVEAQALTQLRNIASLPWVFHHVAAMPDVHLGKGATVGSVIAMKGAVAPAAVGVDIGCGMGAIRTSLKAEDLPDNLHALRTRVEEQIPVGFSEHTRPKTSEALERKLQTLFDEFDSLSTRVRDLEAKARRQIGTLGGGNHFIELCLDSTGAVWMMLHSGSRNIGKTLAEVHMAIAAKLAHNQKLPDRDLSVFLAGTPQMEAYRHDLYWAQRYAFLNREMMFELYKSVMRERFPAISFEDAILCHHNYVAEETHYGQHVIVTRKGAIRAGRGELGIIPGAMGAKSYIVRGLGNEQSFESASHGAGRRMSRTAAKKKFSVEDLRHSTQGVECRKDRGVLDEIAGAYKDIDQVMRNQQDLVEVVAELHGVMVVKG